MATKIFNIYTDGSFKESVCYAYAFVVIDGDNKIVYKESGKGVNQEAMVIHNVAGELSAAMHAAKWLADHNLIGKVHYDYQGVESWVSGEWRCKNKFTLAYRNYMRGKIAHISGFIKVTGHSGDFGNELADKLAKEALLK